VPFGTSEGRREKKRTTSRRSEAEREQVQDKRKKMTGENKKNEKMFAVRPQEGENERRENERRKGQYSRSERVGILQNLSNQFLALEKHNKNG
jgi:hypothetical protein